MSNQNHISYIELPASNFEATKLFFEEAFGWKFQDWGEEYCSFSGAGLDGGFYLSDKSAVVDKGSALVILYSYDLETTLEIVESAKGEIVVPIFSFPGGRRFHFKEPSGNELAVWSDK